MASIPIDTSIRKFGWLRQAQARPPKAIVNARRSRDDLKTAVPVVEYVSELF